MNQYLKGSALLKGIVKALDQIWRVTKFIRTENNLKAAFELSGCDRGNFAVSEQSVSLLQNLPIFGGINSSVIELILKLSSLVRKKRGELFFKEEFKITQ